MKTIIIAGAFLLIGSIASSNDQLWKNIETLNTGKDLGTINLDTRQQYQPKAYKEPVQFKHNPYENRWEQAKPREIIRHNPYENTYQHAKPEAPIIHNPYQDRWEFKR